MGKRSREKEGHRKEKKRRRHDLSPPSPHHLVLDAAVGDRKACKSLLKAGVDVSYADADLNTALHEACRHGHLDVVKLLLKHGAPTSAANSRGDTPAHLAARGRHLEVLAALLQSRHPPDIEARNREGVSVRQLAKAAMEGGSGPSRAHTAQQQQQQQQQQDHDRGPQHAKLGYESEDSWRRRLAAELSDAEDDTMWGGSGHFAADEYETPEEYAQRIWEEMQARRHAQRDAEVAAFRRRRREEEARRSWARQQAEQASQRVLEEEKKKDADWREAVKQGQAGTKRARYEASWQFFATKPHKSPVAYKDVPWILPNEAASPEELERVVLYGTTSAEEKRKRLRLELIRWHPDKFVSKFGALLVEADRDGILERVKATSQLLNALHASIQQQQQ